MQRLDGQEMLDKARSENLKWYWIARLVPYWILWLFNILPKKPR
jgi:hypothetical protein